MNARVTGRSRYRVAAATSAVIVATVALNACSSDDGVDSDPTTAVSPSVSVRESLSKAPVAQFNPFREVVAGNASSPIPDNVPQQVQDALAALAGSGCTSASAAAGQYLATCDADGHPYLIGRVIVRGDQIEKLDIIDKDAMITLSPAGKTAFADYTRDNIGKQTAVVKDGRVCAAPVIQSAIFDGLIQISIGPDDSVDEVADCYRA